jgi:acetyl-CoA carboxylase carboxyl transferase subunit alpha
MEYLDFELPIKELMEQYQTCSLVGEESGVDMKLACSQIEDKIIEKKKID